LHVLPILNDFMRKWPEISISASFGDRYVDLIDEGVDLAIRIGGSEDSRLMTRLLAPHRLVTCASSSYFVKRSLPQTIEQLADHSCLAFVHGGRPVEWRFSENGQSRSVAINGRFAAKGADMIICATGPLDYITTGAGTVRINNQPAAWLSSKTIHKGFVFGLSPNVIYGGPSGGATVGNPDAAARMCEKGAEGRTNKNPYQQSKDNNCGCEAARMLLTVCLQPPPAGSEA
jgi:uncharacterized Zn-binding protein involved in type VI secretion